MIALCGLVSPVQSAAEPAKPPAGGQVKFAQPDEVLDKDWRRSTDVLVTGVGDAGGFHVFAARERDAYQWSALATLHIPALDLGLWTGHTCVTGSGRYAVAVFAPSMATNKPKLMRAGAIAAVIDIDKGTARMVTSRVALVYFSPACGPGDTALLTRSIGADEQETELIRVDAAEAKVVSTRKIAAQLTTPVPAPDGDYGIAGGALVRVDHAGKLAEVAKPTGQPYALNATSNGIDLLSVSGTRAVAQRFSDGHLAVLGDAPVHALQLFGLSGGRSLIVGETSRIQAAPGLRKLARSQRVRAASTNGHLLATSVLPDQIAYAVKAGVAPSEVGTAGRVGITAEATHSGRVMTGKVEVTKSAAVNPLDAVVGPQARNYTTPTCAVLRNDIRRQVLQPTAAMVEWAADRAVKRTLTVQRPANYLKTGLPAYTPQGMFPLPALYGGGTVPAQVELAILAQESNFRQATWRARPGDGGNPLIGDYYGNEAGDGLINYDNADCGYGLSQVTDGMRVGQTRFTATQQAVLTTDYTANIAAGLQILASKWNELGNARMLVNGGDSQYVVNWFLAVWTYNSGFYPNRGDGSPWGVGWYNNPANPRYPANRTPFLRNSYEDAARPGEWSYPEKIMGWAETPQITYFGNSSYPPVKTLSTPGFMDLPPRTQFCGQVNHCDPAAANPCPAETSVCWWNGTTTWSNCQLNCGTENVTYGAQDAEPPMVRQYQPECRGAWSGAIVVDDLPDSTVNIVDCPGERRMGKFTLRLGGNIDPYYYDAQVDLHQLGAAYMGHMWFTHSYSDVRSTVDPRRYFYQHRQVVGTWTPDLPDFPGTRYRILVHLPDHGGTSTVTYVVFPGVDGQGVVHNPRSFTISQDTGGKNEWVVLGEVPLYRGARVSMSNLVPDTNADGSKNLAFDAMAFVAM
ncbi:hypothetical protein ALI144C_07195 [Actinosynnema sp. ALI-1.44]|nr:hypothetical protein ALI144C_07195 [Actinosynnema sp. ALI-1.44]